MKLIKPYFEIIEQEPGLEGIYKQIEIASRTCYKSEDKITPDSAKGFVDRMIKSGHGAMLEHGTVYLKVPVNIDIAPDFLDDVATWTKCKLVQENTGNWWAITTNYRRIIECNYLDHLKYICEPTEYHEKRIAVRFILPIGISREFCRHRVFSFAEQSTRYCNFSADKFNNELTFIEDQWCDEELLRQIEYWYINSYLKPQEKRNLLPLCTKTELVMTGFVSDWRHFFMLRCPVNAHPQARELAIPLTDEFIKRGYLKN